ncbi:MAG: hypothetical protein QME63_04420 [Actinomycetota bacterium]|nr:hypothetical protein [Actinomycetota bacterium]
MSRCKLLVLSTVLCLAVIILSSCSSPGSSVGASAEKPSVLTKEQKSQLISKLKVDFITRYPNDEGLVRIFGSLTNGTDRNLISATIVASDVRTKGKNIVFGKCTINDVKPGETREFEIPTGFGLDEVGDKSTLTVIDAKFD